MLRFIIKHVKFSINSVFSNAFSVVTAKDGPLITGGKTNYKVGELLIVNCSSSKSRQAPVLHWYLNDEMVIS